MAKVGFWLRGARGKLAGSVLQKGENGQTIARENVKPSNPRTKLQATQRACFATATVAAARLLEIIGHTFDGYKETSGDRRRFIELNIPVVRAMAEENNVFVGLNPKGVKTISSQPYIISDGALSPFAIDADAAANSGLLIKGTQVREGESINTYITVANLKAVCPDIAPGSTLSFVYIVENDELAESARVVLQRFTLAPWVTDETIVVNGATLQGNAVVEDSVYGFGESFVDNETGQKYWYVSDERDHGLLWNWNDSEYESVLEVDGYDALNVFQDVLAYGVIVTNVVDGKFVHSPCQLVLTNESWGVDKTTAIESYMNASTVKVPTSDYFTNQAVTVEDEGVQYNSINEALQGVIRVTGYQDKAINFESANTYGPIPERSTVTMYVTAMDGVAIARNSVKVLVGENSLNAVVHGYGNGSFYVVFKLPETSAQSQVVNITFPMNYGNGDFDAAFRTTFQIVQGS